MTVYTSGEWHVKAGREQEFQRIWRDFGGWDFGQSGGDEGAVLLRDRQDARHYRSFGRWPDEASMSRWQASDGFASWMDALRPTLEDMGSYIMDVAETVGTSADMPTGTGAMRR